MQTVAALIEPCFPCSSGGKVDLITDHQDIRLDLREKKYALVTTDEFSIAPELATDRPHLWEDWATLEPD